MDWWAGPVPAVGSWVAQAEPMWVELVGAAAAAGVVAGVVAGVEIAAAALVLALPHSARRQTRLG